MPKPETLIRSDGERLQVIRTPDAETISAQNRTRHWWNWQLQIRVPIMRVLVGICLIAALVIINYAPPLDPIVNNHFFAATPRPDDDLLAMMTSIAITTANPPTTPAPTLVATPIVSALPTWDSSQELQLVGSAAQQVTVRECQAADLRRMSIVFTTKSSSTDADRSDGIPFLMDSHGTDICVLAREGMNDVNAPRWGHVPNSIVFAETRSEESNETSRITILKADADEEIDEQTLVEISDEIANFDISPTSGVIAYSNPSGVFLHNYGTNIASYRGRDPSWSPNGTTVMFISLFYPGSNGNSPRLGYMSNAMDGRWNTHHLTSYPVGGIAPVWHPNEEQIAFLDRDGDILTLDATSTRYRSQRVTYEVSDIYAIDWLSDGSGIAFAALFDGQRGALFVTDLDGNVRQVTPRIMGLESFDWR